MMATQCRECGLMGEHHCAEAAHPAPAATSAGTVAQEYAFGFGQRVVNWGDYNGRPAVFIAPAKQPGNVGDSAERENIPRHELVPGEIVLTFPTEEQSRVVEAALMNRANAAPPAAPAPAVPVDGYRLVPTKEKLRELLVVGARVKVGEQYAEKHGFEAGEVLTLVEGEFDGDNGLFATTEYAPAVWNEGVGEFDSIFHLFENDLSGFMDCEVLPAAPAATKEA